MRHLKKLSEPEILKDKSGEWTRRYLAAIDRSTFSPWRHNEIVSQLREEVSEKCAYCEGIIADVSYAAVEHIEPKQSVPHRVVDWQNLTRACAVCNTNKGAYYSPDERLLNPYIDDPSIHLWFRGPLVTWRLGDDMARRTVIRLDLSRPALLAERAKRIQELHNVITQWNSATGTAKDLLALVIDRDISEEAEFCESLRHYAKDAGFPSPAENRANSSG